MADFWTAMRAFLNRSEAVAKRHGLTPQRYQLLLMIEGSDGGCSTITDLAERLRLAQNTVTDLVARAEEAGLVDREVSTVDQRVRHLRLSDVGRHLIREIMHELRGDRQTLEAIISALRKEELSRRHGAG